MKKHATYQKFMVSLAMAAVVAVSAVIPASAVGFTDVSKLHPQYKEITELAKSGAILGYSDGTFKPYKELLRSNVVKIIGK
ncbi:MAG: S-layer homology domain-containing protein [Lysinibacillus sp.]